MFDGNSDIPELMKELKFLIESFMFCPTPVSEGIGSERKLPDDMVLKIKPDMDFNAGAGLTGSHGPYYEFNYGIMLAAKHIACNLMCIPDVCPWLPFHSEETIDLSAGHSVVDILRWAQDDLKLRPGAHMPSKYLETVPPGGNTQRIQFGEMISRSIIMFIAAHEQSHFHFGHSLFASRRLKTQAYPEFDQVRHAIGHTEAEAQRLNFFMEHQADSYAMQSMYRSIAEAGLPPSDDAMAREKVCTFPDYLTSHTLGIQISTGLFELCERFLMEKYAPGSSAFRTHPTAASRRMHCYRIYLDCIVRRMPTPYDMRKANETFLIHDTVVSNMLGIPELSLDMVKDALRDCTPEQALTTDGEELLAYRHNSHDLLELMMPFCDETRDSRKTQSYCTEKWQMY